MVSPGAQLYPEAWQRVARACLHPEEVADDITRHNLWGESTRLSNLAGLYRPAPAPLLKTALAMQGILAHDATAPDTAPAPPPQKQKFLNFPALHLNIPLTDKLR